MKATLTPAEAKTIIQFLNRVDLKGNESDTHAFVKSKLSAIMDGRDEPVVQDAKTR